MLPDNSQFTGKTYLDKFDEILDEMISEKQNDPKDAYYSKPFTQPKRLTMWLKDKKPVDWTVKSAIKHWLWFYLALVFILSAILAGSVYWLWIKITL